VISVMAAAAGTPLDELFAGLLGEAVERHRVRGTELRTGRGFS
jgi:hypothetical protein